MSTTFTSLTSQQVLSYIKLANKRIVYLAPSISKAIADGLLEKMDLSVLEVIIDDNADVYRLGYGEVEAIDKILRAGIRIRKASPLRIGVLIIDDSAWIFSSNALIIEEEPTERTLNAISVQYIQALELLKSVLPAGESHTQLSLLPEKPEIAQEKFTIHDINFAKQELSKRPPKQFDKERKVNVYSSYFQFVELRIVGVELNRRTVQIPSKLLNTQNNKEIDERLKTTYKLIEENGKLSTQKIKEKVNDIRKSYIKSMGNNVGSVILRSAKDDFLQEIDKLRKEVEIFSGKCKESLEKYLNKTRDDLIKILIPGIVKNPPNELQAGITTKKPTKEIAIMYLNDELKKVIPVANEFLQTMKVECDFKDVTYEMLNDGDFQQKIRMQFPYVEWPLPFEESEAIKEKIKV